ncbi:MAG: TIGR02597 family protein, partial [Planctomycetota bacterium]
MRTTLFTAMVAATLLALAGPTIADEPIVLGYNKIIVPKDADVVISVPFVNKAEATYTVASTSSPSVSVVEALPVSTYADGLYYVRFTTGNAKGFWSTISSNPAGQLVLEDDSFFAKIGDGDEFKVYKHQTLAGVFPANLEDFSMLASEKNPFLPAIQTFKTQVQIFDPNSKRLVLHRSSHAHGSDQHDPEHRYLLCDLENDCALSPLTHETGATGPSVSPDGRWLYYFVNETETGG